MRALGAACVLFAAATAAGQSLQSPAGARADLRADLRLEVEQHFADVADLERRFDVPMSATRRERLAAVHRARREALAALDFATLGRDARIDLLLLDDRCAHELSLLEREAQQDAAALPLLPFAATVIDLCERRRALEPLDGERSAGELATAATGLAEAQRALAAGAHDAAPLPDVRRALDRAERLRRALRTWFEFGDGYDPLFSWWCRAPWRALDEAIASWTAAVRKKLVDARTGDASLIGDPIGEAALRRELDHERIPYSAAELVEIAEREFAWCDAETAKASRELGCGDDWRKALELVKTKHVAPGKQPELIRELAHEAIAFLEERALVTVPPLAKECWRMRMLSPAAQRVNPFFLGGETIQVAFPTDDMAHAEKLQSLRSNNVHFCRATVHHELIPGHWLQHYSQARWRPYRTRFATPFWIEGWALYWEMRLYDLGLARSPEDRVGMLYWRKHRCARIVFSLRFHLGQWDARKCVDYLIERVGHEPAAAEAEVRRSVGGDYGPLYQAAYMLGGLQFRALHGELVTPPGGEGRFAEREFHDEVLRQNAIPVALLREVFAAEPPGRDAGRGWRFADPPR